MDLSNENVIHIKKDGLQYLQFKKLLQYEDKIRHAYSLGIDKDFGTSEEQQVGKAIDCYKDLCSSIGMDVNNLIKPIQKHTKNVKAVLNKENQISYNDEQYDETDGLITNKKGVTLATTNADCILLIFYDPIKNVIANIHSGWRGTLQRISTNTIKKMEEEYNCNPKDIICCICPSIRKCHFEVSKDVKEMFYEEFKNLEKIENIIEETIPNKKWHIDTVLINKIILEQKGLKKENIIDSGLCSVCHSDIIHSYRVEGKDFGRSTAIIGLRERK